MGDWREPFARVKAALLRRGRSDQDADDLVQEAWLRLACYEENQSVEKPEAFLMRVALNLSVDLQRSRTTRGDEVMLDDVVLVDIAPSAEAVLLAKERTARLSACLTRLSEQTRNIFLAHRVEGLTYRVIAARHAVSVSTVEKHVAKALSQLTTWMEGW